MFSQLWRGARAFPSAPPCVMRRTRPGRRRSCRPGVEALEDREVPACTVTVAPDAPGVPGVPVVLTVTGDDGDNSVLITLERSTGILSVVCDGAVTPVPLELRQVVVRTLGGNDRVAFQNTTAFGGIEADLGGGDDSFSFQLSDDHLPPSLEVSGGDGKDQMNVSLDGVGPQFTLGSRVTLDGGAGNDTLRVRARNLSVSPADFHAGSLTVAVNGQEGADRLSAEVVSSNPFASKRIAVFTLSGGGGPDRVSAATLGALTVRVRGEGGNDRLALTARDLRKALHHPDARLRGGPGTDVCQAAGRVRVDGCEL
jgi:hypothetical protein